MSADLLRKAASLMRERAEAATYVYAAHHSKAGQTVPWFEGGDCYSFDEGDGPHIMAWSPAVALAVADWLEATAGENDSPDDSALGFLNFISADAIAALAVARAYLGESA